MAFGGTPDAIPPEQIAQNANYLRRLHEILTERYRLQNGGKDPPPPTIRPPRPSPGALFDRGSIQREGGFFGSPPP
jgi:hypothetical protein